MSGSEAASTKPVYAKGKTPIVKKVGMTDFEEADDPNTCTRIYKRHYDCSKMER